MRFLGLVILFVVACSPAMAASFCGPEPEIANANLKKLISSSAKGYAKSSSTENALLQALIRDPNYYNKIFPNSSRQIVGGYYFFVVCNALVTEKNGQGIVAAKGRKKLAYIVKAYANPLGLAKILASLDGKAKSQKPPVKAKSKAEKVAEVAKIDSKKVQPVSIEKTIAVSEEKPQTQTGFITKIQGKLNQEAVVTPKPSPPGEPIFGKAVVKRENPDKSENISAALKKVMKKTPETAVIAVPEKKPITTDFIVETIKEPEPEPEPEPEAVAVAETKVETETQEATMPRRAIEMIIPMPGPIAVVANEPPPAPKKALTGKMDLSAEIAALEEAPTQTPTETVAPAPAADLTPTAALAAAPEADPEPEVTPVAVAVAAPAQVATPPVEVVASPPVISETPQEKCAKLGIIGSKECTDIDAILSKLKSVPLEYNQPKTMYLDKRTQITLVLNTQNGDVSKEFKGHSGKISQGETKVSQFMQAELSGQDFDVEPKGPLKRIVSSHAPTKWTWYVKPLTVGAEKALSLNLSAILQRDNKDLPPVAIKTFHTAITVDVKFWHLVVKKIAAFDPVFQLITAIGGIITATLFGWRLFLWFRQRQLKQAGF